MKEKIVEVFIKKINQLQTSHTLDISEGKDLVHLYTNQIYHMHDIMKKVLQEIEDYDSKKLEEALMQE